MLIFFDHPRKNETASLLKPKDFWKSPRLIENLLFSGTSCRAFWPLAPHPLAVLFQTLKRSCAMPCRVHRSASKATRSKMKNRREGFRRLTWLTWNPKMMAWKMIDFLSGAYSQGSILILLGCSPEQYGNTMGNWENYKIVTYIATSYMTQPLRATQPLDFVRIFFPPKKTTKTYFQISILRLVTKSSLLRVYTKGFHYLVEWGYYEIRPENSEETNLLRSDFANEGVGWKNWHIVDGSEILHQLRLAVYPIIYKVLCIPDSRVTPKLRLETTDSCLPAKM